MKSKRPGPRSTTNLFSSQLMPRTTGTSKIVPRKPANPSGRCNDLNAITLLSSHAFGCDVNAKVVIASKRSCRFHLYAFTHKADNISRIAELLPSRHYRNRYPPDKMSLTPKAQGAFFSKHLQNKDNNDGHNRLDALAPNGTRHAISPVA